jgi:myo-inositol 2-dehydrogenase / D-chiro-inositol 1-dehydrogenase
LLDRKDIDVVDIVVPTYLHYEVAAAALQAGKHVLLEKPMTDHGRTSQQLCQLAEAQDCLLAVGFELRLSHLWGRVKQMIDQGAIGQPQYCLVELWRKPYRLGSDGWRYDIRRVGNWILEEPIHFFDLARWYLSSLGDPLAVTARAKARRPEHPELSDNFSALVDFPGGAYAVISQTLSGFEHHQVAKVTGSEGALWASWSGAMDRTFTPQFSLRYQRGGDEAVSVDCGGPAGEVFELVQQIERVVRAVRDGIPLHAGGHDGWWAVRMCEAAALSAKNGRTEAI